MTIGLYHIDLWHGNKAYPHLELMQIYNYLYQRNEKVLFLKPGEDIGRCNKVIYFDDNCKIPRDLEVRGEKKQQWGYGFYRINEKLKPEIAAMEPCYFPYDAWTNKLSAKSKYEKLKRSSYVRLETENFGGFKSNATSIFFADNRLFSVAALTDFLDEHKRKHDFCCIHPPRIESQEIAEKVSRYTEIFNCRFTCAFKFSEDFLYEYLSDFDFSFKPFEDEDTDSYTERIVKMALLFKSKNKTNWILEIDKRTPLLKYIDKWIRSAPSNMSYNEYYHGDQLALNEMIKAATNARLFLKMSPQCVTRENLHISHLLND